MVGRRTGPLQGFGTVEPHIIHTGILRRDRGDLPEDRGRIRVRKLLRKPKPGREIAEDLPVGLCLPDRLLRFPYPLDPALGIDYDFGAFSFKSISSYIDRTVNQRYDGTGYELGSITGSTTVPFDPYYLVTIEYPSKMPLP
jgi:hypothetical protein